MYNPNKGSYRRESHLDKPKITPFLQELNFKFHADAFQKPKQKRET